jgi:hypothetical protein
LSENAGSKYMVYRVQGNFVERLEKNADRISEYFDSDYITWIKESPLFP